MDGDMTIRYFAIVLVLVAMASDLRSRKIPNILTYSSIFAAFLLRFVLGGGVSGILFTATGLLVGFALLLLPFLFGGMGAGDVKLMAALGALLGPRDILGVFVNSLIAGGFVAVVYLSLRGDLWRGLKNAASLAGRLMKLQFRRDPDDDENNWISMGKIPYGVAIGLGTIATLTPILMGRAGIFSVGP